VPQWIDMHHEIRALMHGDRKTVAQGYWAVIRIMRIGQYSEYWNEDRQEAIGGPKWNYDDFIVRCIDMPAASLLSLPRLRSTEADIVYAGLEDVNTQIFAIEAIHKPPLQRLPRLPGNDDIMFHINKHHSREVPRPPFIATGRYNITGAIPARGDHGRIEVFYMTAIRMHGES